MAESTWETRELPILEAVLRLERTDIWMNAQSIGAAAGIDEADAALGIAALVDAGYLDATTSGLADVASRVNHANEKARRATGQWPSLDPFDGSGRIREA